MDKTTFIYCLLTSTVGVEVAHWFLVMLYKLSVPFMEYIVCISGFAVALVPLPTTFCSCQYLSVLS